jgi:hypothetical protein
MDAMVSERKGRGKRKERGKKGERKENGKEEAKTIKANCCFFLVKRQHDQNCGFFLSPLLCF